MNFKIMKNTSLNCELSYIVDASDTIWFRGKSVAEILGYKKSRNAIFEHVDSDDKEKLVDLGRPKIGPLSHNQKNTIFINESGLYSLILSSKLEKAKEFRKWATEEVPINSQIWTIQFET